MFHFWMRITLVYEPPVTSWPHHMSDASVHWGDVWSSLARGGNDLEHGNVTSSLVTTYENPRPSQEPPRCSPRATDPEN